MKIQREAIDEAVQAERHLEEVRAHHHHSMLFYLSCGMNTRMKLDAKSPILTTTNMVNGIDRRLLEDTDLLKSWLSEMQSIIESSLRNRGYEFDSTELSIDWPSNEAPQRAQFIFVAHRTIPQPHLPLYRRLLGLHS